MANEILKVGEIISFISAKFATQVTSEDSFETERQKIRASAREFQEAGKPLRIVAKMIASVDSKERDFGPGKNIEIRLQDEILFYGQIYSKWGVLRGSPKATVSHGQLLLSHLATSELCVATSSVA